MAHRHQQNTTNPPFAASENAFLNSLYTDRKWSPWTGPAPSANSSARAVNASKSPSSFAEVLGPMVPSQSEKLISSVNGPSGFSAFQISSGVFPTRDPPGDAQPLASGGLDVFHRLEHGRFVARWR